MSVFRRIFAIILLACATLNSTWAGGDIFIGSSSQFLAAEQVFKLDPPDAVGTSWQIQGRIARGNYVYRHSLKAKDADGRTVPLELPEGERKHDEFFGDTEIFKADAARLKFPVSTKGPVELQWQGCAEAGICYPPQTVVLALPAPTAGPLPLKTAPPLVDSVSNSLSPDTTSGAAQDQVFAQRLATLGPFAGSLLFFGLGVLLAFTPCTLPMVPIISTMVIGSGARPQRAFTLSMAYVVTMATTYALVGVAAGMAGANLQATLQSPWLLSAFSALFALLAASLFGAFELRLPSSLMNRIEAAGTKRAGGSLMGAAVMGLLSALLVGPCMTAPLAGVLLYISQTGSGLQGGLALFALGMGMGLPLLAIAAFGARVLPKPGAWMDRVRLVFGYLMLGMAVYILSRILAGSISLMLWGAWGLALATGLFAWSYDTEKRRLAWTLRFSAAFAGLWSSLLLIGAASGAESPVQPLVQLTTENMTKASSAQNRVHFLPAKSESEVDELVKQAGVRGQWTVIDFYADWCASCHVNERNVFGDATVISKLATAQVIRPDVTANDRIDKALLRRWGVMGPPTLVFVGPDGKERRSLRIVGEISAMEFLNRWGETIAL